MQAQFAGREYNNNCANRNKLLLLLLLYDIPMIIISNLLVYIYIYIYISTKLDVYPSRGMHTVLTLYTVPCIKSWASRVRVGPV